MFYFLHVSLFISIIVFSFTLCIVNETFGQITQFKNSSITNFNSTNESNLTILQNDTDNARSNGNQTEGIQNRPSNQSLRTIYVDGLVSSIILNTMDADNTNDLNNLLPYIVGGNWSLNVNANKTDFKSKFTMVKIDGTDSHQHEIVNFTAISKNTSFQPHQNQTSIIVGSADLVTNNNTVWSNIDITLIIDKLAALTIIPSPSETSNHFRDQSIYGIVSRIEK